jgi:16S rRNA processing protein RimM
LKGEVAVLSLSQVESRFEPGSKLFIGEGERTVTVTGARGHRGRLLVTFEEIHDRDQAEALRGEYLFVSSTSAPPLPEGEYWPHELVGARVVTTGGRAIGAIDEIIRTPANDVWVARSPGGEVLIPALKDVVESVDVPGRRIVVREVPGLTAP